MEARWVVFVIVLVLALGAWALWVAGRLASVVRRSWTGFLAFVVLLSAVAAQRIDDVLQALHRPGAPSAGIGDVASLDPERGEAAVASWAEFASPMYVARWQLVFHVVVVVALPLLLGHLLRAVTRWPDDPGRTSLRGVAGFFALVVVPAAVLAGILQSAALFWATQAENPPGFAFSAAGVLDFLWLFGGVIPCALVLAAAWALRAQHRRAERKELVRAVTAVRLQIAVVLMFTFLLHGPIAGEQAADVMLRWVEPGTSWPAGVLAAILAMCLSAVVLAASGSLLQQDREEWRGPANPWVFVAGGLAAAAVGGVAWAAFDQLSGLVVLGVGLLAYGLVALIPGEDPEFERLELSADAARRLTLVVAAVPLVALGLAIQSAAIGEYVYVDAYDRRLGVLVLGGIVMQALGWLLVVRGPWALGFVTRLLPDGIGRAPGVLGLLATAVLAPAVTLAILIDPWWTGDLVGTVGVFAVFSIVTAGVAYLVALPEQRYTPPPFLAGFGVNRRIPILLGLVAWLGASAFLDDHGYHHARVVEGEEKATIPEADLGQVWDRWLKRNEAALRPGSGRTSVPLVLVAATGGGIRAAYWTARGLERISATGGTAPIFALSGASGGSVGEAFFVANGREEEQPEGDWVKERLGRDFLAPTWAWTLFADVPQAFLHLDWGRDRAAVLEGAWERSLGALEDPVRRGWAEGGDEPLMLLNSTTVDEGCRLNVSPLAADGRSSSCLSIAHDGAFAATEDLTDVLCDEDDLRLSTAAMMSARFPFVTPSGGLPRCPGKGEGVVHGVDGGYFDNTAASPITELLPAIQRRVDAHNRDRSRPCIRPVLVQLDNTYEQTDVRPGNPRPFEPGVPLMTMFKVIGIGPGREASNRQAAAHLFGPSRYARLYPLAHPGTTPPLGWTLSRISMEDMDEEYDRRQNADELARIASWIDGEAGCDE
jgi:hypothetical protein